MRGINLGCGSVILPCERPGHHLLIPEWLYGDGIEWDNADWNALEGVNKVVDLFDYPWPLETGVYDYAIASHIVEHIPHHIVSGGQFVARHPEWQDGWFAWFAELHRILKPGGQAWILCPYAFSDAGVSDPTHTRYLTAATFGYFRRPDNDSPFVYRQGGRWTVADVWVNPHEDAVREVRRQLEGYLTLDDATFGDLFNQALSRVALARVNAVVELCVRLVKDAD